MPWRETGAVDEREGFVEEVLAGVFSKAAVCRRYGVSRVTGDKWLERYRAEGRAGLGGGTVRGRRIIIRTPCRPRRPR